MPVYTYTCRACEEEHTFTAVKPMDQFDTPELCPEAGIPGERMIHVPNVMNAAFPDGNRRFDNVRRYRELETQRRSAMRRNDKTTQGIVQSEINKLTGKDS